MQEPAKNYASRRQEGTPYLILTLDVGYTPPRLQWWGG